VAKAGGIRKQTTKKHKLRKQTQKYYTLIMCVIFFPDRLQTYMSKDIRPRTNPINTKACTSIPFVVGQPLASAILTKPPKSF